jgi:molecular chaperone GrpE (heat shock protein)
MRHLLFFIHIKQQLDLAVPTDSEQLDVANLKIAELQKQLSEAKAKCLETEQKLEDYQRDAHVIF